MPLPAASDPPSSTLPYQICPYPPPTLSTSTAASAAPATSIRCSCSPLAHCDAQEGGAGSAEEAAQHCNLALALAPDSAKAYFRRGLAMLSSPSCDVLPAPPAATQPSQSAATTISASGKGNKMDEMMGAAKSIMAAKRGGKPAEEEVCVDVCDNGVPRMRQLAASDPSCMRLDPAACACANRQHAGADQRAKGGEDAQGVCAPAAAQRPRLLGRARFGVCLCTPECARVPFLNPQRPQVPRGCRSSKPFLDSSRPPLASARLLLHLRPPLPTCAGLRLPLLASFGRTARMSSRRAIRRLQQVTGPFLSRFLVN